MNVRTIIGYHATTIQNKEKILQEGFEFSKQSKNKKHWLGKGVYFFEDCYHAVNWNILTMHNDLKKGKQVEINDYAILKSSISCDREKAINLSSPEGTIIYKHMRNKIKEKYIKNNREESVNFLKDRSSKFWIAILEENGFFDNFDVLIAVYIEKDNQEIRFSDDFIYGYQMQICVKNRNCIKSTKEYKDDERISEIYDIISKEDT